MKPDGPRKSHRIEKLHAGKKNETERTGANSGQSGDKPQPGKKETNINNPLDITQKNISSTLSNLSNSPSNERDNISPTDRQSDDPLASLKPDGPRKSHRIEKLHAGKKNEIDDQ